MTQVLMVTTVRPDVRSEINGWTHEDASLYVRGKPVGYTPGPRTYYTPGNVLQALADGWKLLGPPKAFQEPFWDEKTDVQTTRTCYEWCLTKESD